MASFQGKEVKSKTDVDKITTDRINALFGSPEEEKKYHRLALTGFYLQINPNMQGGSRNKEIQPIIEKVLPKFVEVEKIIREGKEFNELQGWR